MQRLLCMFFCLVLVGCAARDQAKGGGHGEVYGEADYAPAAEEASESRAFAASRPSPRPSSAPAAQSAMMDGAPAPMDLAPEEPASPAPSRMVHYHAWLRLRVLRQDEAVKALTALAEARGGLVERIYGATVVLRVPVEGFEESLAEVQALGETLERSIGADDVTDQFLALDLRLMSAEATRTRLVALLARAEDEREKLELLRQIQRVTEQIDLLKAQTSTLADLAARSRITVELVPREALAGVDRTPGPLELAWVGLLSPFSREVAVASKPLPFATPEGLVALATGRDTELERRAFVAESPDGTRVWTHRLENVPEGDAAFWVGALKNRMEREFASAESEQVGSWTVLRLVDRSAEPYTWWVAVRVVGRRLELVQAFFPDSQQEARYEAGVRQSLTGGGAT